MTFEFFDLGDFTFASGVIVPNVKLAYRTVGKLNAAKDNAILFPTFLAAPPNGLDMWIGEGRPLDPTRYFIILPGHFGLSPSTSPENTAPPFDRGAFPAIDIADDVIAQHRLVTELFGISELQLILGWSVGSLQLWEWAVRFAPMVKRMASIAGTPVPRPWTKLWLRYAVEEQITCDPAFNNGFYRNMDDVQAGIRRVGHVTAITAPTDGFYREGNELWRPLGFASGDDAVKRMFEPLFMGQDPNGIIAQARKAIAADPAHGGDLAAALGTITAKAVVAGFTGDFLFPPEEARRAAAHVPDATFHEIPSSYGHMATFGLAEQDVKTVDGLLHDLLASLRLSTEEGISTMSKFPRRRFAGASMAGGGAVGVSDARPASAALDVATVPDAVAVTVDDPSYTYLTTRGKNRRYTGTPTSIYQVYNADQVRQVVDQIVASGQQLAVRSGGHALDDLVDAPEVTALIDTSHMNAAYYDPAYQAIAVESGALLGDVYKTLYPTYGFVPPCGSCPTVGVSGFTMGGGFGTLCRKHGLIADHLYGVEVVVVGKSGRASVVVATREASDPNRDLWWAHTGSGGGNFGVATRFLFRSPEAEGAGPAGLLPAPPRAVITTTMIWPWNSMTEPDFTRIVNNHGAWHAANSAPGTEYSTLYSEFGLASHVVGGMELVAQIDATVPNAQALMDAYVAAVSSGVNATMFTKTATANWLTTLLTEPFPSAPPEDNRVKSKGACLRQPFSADQVATMYRYLSDPKTTTAGAMVVYSLGGQVSATAPDATAVAQRDSILRTLLISSWANPAQDEQNVAWTREFYRDLYAGTGGVPVPDDATDGSYINFPDADFTDPTWNTSDVPWYTLYFKDNYPRLQQIKAAYDPGNVFRHPLSIQLPG